jgi:hypothetical protein
MARQRGLTPAHPTGVIDMSPTRAEHWTELDGRRAIYFCDHCECLSNDDQCPNGCLANVRRVAIVDRTLDFERAAKESSWDFHLVWTGNRHSEDDGRRIA